MIGIELRSCIRGSRPEYIFFTEHACLAVLHANIIATEKGATGSDVRCLIELMKAEVKEEFGVELEKEIVIVGGR